jgi:putative transposase
MEQRRVRTTYQYRLNPIPALAQVLEAALHRCRTLYNVALEQRRTWWARGQGKRATYEQQKAELPDLKADFLDYAEVHSQVLQDVLLRLERAYQAFFRRVQAGETPGYPRFQGKDRSHSFTYPQYGNGAVLDGGILSLSTIGRIPLRLHRPLDRWRARPRPSQSRERRMAGMSPSGVPRCPRSRCRALAGRPALMWV